MRFRTAFKEVERAERVARSLNEHHRRAQFEQNLVAELRPVAGGAKRIAEADHGCDRLNQGDMASDAPAHAFAGQHDRPVMLFAQRRQRGSMGGDELRQRVRPFSAIDRVKVVERLDGADRGEETRESPHPRMR